MTLRIDPDWLRRKIESGPEDPPGCPHCGAIAGACSAYPNCPGGPKPDVVSGERRP